MRLTTLVAGILCCAVFAGAQETVADDYPDYYYDDVAPEEEAATSAKDAGVPDNAKGATKDAMPAEGETVDDAVTEAATEPPATTTTEASNGGRRKLVSLKSTKITRNRGPRPRPTGTEAPKAEKTTDAATEATSTTPARGSSRLRSSSVRGRGRTSQPQAAATEAPERAETETPARGRFSPNRGSFRPSSRGSSSSTTTTEEESNKSSASTNRFRPTPRSSFRPSSSKRTEEPEEPQETSTNHRFSSVRRGSLSSRRGSNFNPSRSTAEETEADAAAVEPEVEQPVVENTRRSRFGARGRS